MASLTNLLQSLLPDKPIKWIIKELKCICRLACTHREWYPIRNIKRWYSFDTHSPTYAISSYASSESRNFLKCRKLGNKILETRAVFILAGGGGGGEAQKAEGSKIILLGDNTGCVTAMLRASRSQCDGNEFRLDSILCTRAPAHMHTQFLLPKKSTCACSCGTLTTA